MTRVAPTFVSSAGGFTTGSPLVVAYPGSGAAGDFLLLHVRCPTGNGIPNPAAPGWTALAAEQSVNGMKSRVFYRLADGTESGNVSIAISGGTGGTRSARIGRYRGTDPFNATPWESYAFESQAASTTMNDVGVTTSGDGRLAVNMTSSNSNSAIPSFTGETGGDWTVRADGGSGTPNHRMTIQAAAMASAGTIDGGSCTVTSTAYHNHGLALIGKDDIGKQFQAAWVG